MRQIEGNIIDIYNRKIFPGIISVENGVITSISKNSKNYDYYISPGFIDSHVHIESSMLIPAEFSKLAIQKGTIAVVNDPHEIANVLGREGIDFMIENSKDSAIKMYFTIPSSVPATCFDFSGGSIRFSDVEELLKSNHFIGLSEMMNVPGVINNDPEIIQKIELVRQFGFVVDGHAPGLIGENLKKYINFGISTDHECTDIQEALEKIHFGMKILIREGSAAKNYEALKSLIATYSDRIMFCTDDSHPGDLIKFGHIDKIVRRAIKDGFDLFDILKIACINPISHYNLNVGELRVGDSADFIIIDNLKDFNVFSVYIDGEEKYNKYQNNELFISSCNYLNNFNINPINLSELKKSVQNELVCIKVFDGELITEKGIFSIENIEDNFESDIDRDILKIVYLNRYKIHLPQIAFINGIGLKSGAFATSVSHDSHNIVAVGTNDVDLRNAINMVIENKGGLSVVDSECKLILPLPIAGIMTDKSGFEVARVWDQLINQLKIMGCKLDSPFMTLSFMTLIVIPELKIGEEGLFEYSKFSFMPE